MCSSTSLETTSAESLRGSAALLQAATASAAVFASGPQSALCFALEWQLRFGLHSGCERFSVKVKQA